MNLRRFIAECNHGSNSVIGVVQAKTLNINLRGECGSDILVKGSPYAVPLDECQLAQLGSSRRQSSCTALYPSPVLAEIYLKQFGHMITYLHCLEQEFFFGSAKSFCGTCNRWAWVKALYIEIGDFPCSLSKADLWARLIAVEPLSARILSILIGRVAESSEDSITLKLIQGCLFKETVALAFHEGTLLRQRLIWIS